MTEDTVQRNPKRVQLSVEELRSLTRDELVTKWKEQETFINHLESKNTSETASDGVGSQEFDEKIKQQQLESARRENILVMRLTSKEQEVQELASQISELKQVQLTNSAQLRGKLLDPAVNLMFQRMKKEMEQAKEKMEQTQSELSAWKFTPDSQTGKRLMAKCRMLYQENEELGKNISSGRTAKLESDIALERKLIEEMKSAQNETDEFLGELDEDVEGMQSTIYLLQQQLKEAKDQITQYEQLLTQHGLQSQPTEGTNSSELFQTSQVQMDNEHQTIGSVDDDDEHLQVETSSVAIDVAMETDIKTESVDVNSCESTEEEVVNDHRTHFTEDSDTWSPDPYSVENTVVKERTSESQEMETEGFTNGIGSPSS